MKHAKVYRVLPLLIFLLAPILVACGGGDSDDSEATEIVLPTRAVLGEVTEAVAPQSSNNTPPEVTDIAPPTNTDATPEVNAPATSENNTPPQASTPSTNGGPPESTAQVNEPTPLVVTDFNQLSENIAGIFIGTLSIETNEEAIEPIIRLTDNAGNSVQIIIPPVFSEELNGQIVQIQGVVTLAEANTDALVVRATNIALEGEEFAQGGPPINGAPNADLPEGVPTPGAPPEGPTTSQVELLDLQLEENLSALGAYDALWAELGDTLADTLWLALSGNTELGWTLEFYSEETDSTASYTITADGMVGFTNTQNFLPPNTELNPIDRELIVVDSDDLPEPEANTNGPPIGIPVLILRATTEGNIEWTIQGANPTPIDATIAQ